MAEVSAYQAKTHFSQLLARAEKGEHVTITKHGRPVAALVPLGFKDKRSLDEILRSMQELRKGTSLEGLKLKDLIAEGRR